MSEDTQKNEPAKAVEKPKTCAVYIDGFNAYYGIFKFRPDLKWLNYRSYFQKICHPWDVAQIYYFTALIKSTDKASMEKNARQAAYLKALRSLPNFKIVLGNFQNKEVNCQVCYKGYSYPQEKQTDVNMAMAMTIDAMQGKYDAMVLVSGDSDIHPVFKWIKLNRPNIALFAYLPILPDLKEKRKADALNLMAIKNALLPLEELKHHQFENPLKLPFGEIQRPKTWV